jgi:hypothetical protein
MCPVLRAHPRRCESVVYVANIRPKFSKIAKTAERDVESVLADDDGETA